MAIQKPFLISSLVSFISLKKRTASTFSNISSVTFSLSSPFGTLNIQLFNLFTMSFISYLYFLFVLSKLLSLCVNISYLYFLVVKFAFYGFYRVQLSGDIVNIFIYFLITLTRVILKSGFDHSNIRIIFCYCIILFHHISLALLVIFQRMLDSKHKNYKDSVWYYLPEKKIWYFFWQVDRRLKITLEGRDFKMMEE